MNLKRFKVSLLRNEEHYQFHSEVNELLNGFDTKALKIDSIVTNYNTLLPEERMAITQIRKSVTTLQIKTAKKERNSIYRGILDAVLSSCHHFDPKKSESAKRLALLFDQHGNINKKSYKDSSATVRNLVHEATDAFALDFTILQLNDWVKELNARGTTFDSLVKRRYTELSSKPSLKMKKIRPQLDLTFRALCDHVNALTLLYGTDGYELLIQELNIRTEKFKLHLAQRKGRAVKKTSGTKAKIENLN